MQARQFLIFYFLLWLFREGKEVTGETHLRYAWSTHNVDCFLEHMEMLFSHVGKLRSVAVLFSVENSKIIQLGYWVHASSWVLWLFTERVLQLCLWFISAYTTCTSSHIQLVIVCHIMLESTAYRYHLTRIIYHDPILSRLGYSISSIFLCFHLLS